MRRLPVLFSLIVWLTIGCGGDPEPESPVPKGEEVVKQYPWREMIKRFASAPGITLLDGSERECWTDNGRCYTVLLGGTPTRVWCTETHCEFWRRRRRD